MVTFWLTGCGRSDILKFIELEHKEAIHLREHLLMEPRCYTLRIPSHKKGSLWEV